MNQYLVESTLFQGNTETYNNRIYTSVLAATTQTALDLSGDEVKTVCKAILGSASLRFDFRSGTSAALLGTSTVD